MEGFPRLLLFILCYYLVFVRSDDVTDRRTEMQKLLRDMSMANQTKADTLNLPANASSIRPNITDTFSCENRTYGYYADVDNGCQVFHVCLPTQNASWKNTTYRWSFICPNETIFNQEVLTCTRPRDSIPCEDSPEYYYLNNEIGKTNDSRNSTKPMEEAPMKNMRRQSNEKTQNMIVKRQGMSMKKENMVMNKDVVMINEAMVMKNENVDKKNKAMVLRNEDQILENEDMKNEDLITKDEDMITNIEDTQDDTKASEENFGDKIDQPVIHEVGKVYETKRGNTRLALERSLLGKKADRRVQNRPKQSI